MATAVAPIVSDREWNAHILAQLAGGKLTQEQALAQLKTAPKSNGGPLVLQAEREGRCQRLRLAAHARHALRRAVGAALGIRARRSRASSRATPLCPASSGASKQRADSLALPPAARVLGSGQC